MTTYDKETWYAQELEKITGAGYLHTPSTLDGLPLDVLLQVVSLAPYSQPVLPKPISTWIYHQPANDAIWVTFQYHPGKEADSGFSLQQITAEYKGKNYSSEVKEGILPAADAVLNNVYQQYLTEAARIEAGRSIDRCCNIANEIRRICASGYVDDNNPRLIHRNVLAAAFLDKTKECAKKWHGQEQFVVDFTVKMLNDVPLNIELYYNYSSQAQEFRLDVFAAQAPGEEKYVGVYSDILPLPDYAYELVKQNTRERLAADLMSKVSQTILKTPGRQR